MTGGRLEPAALATADLNGDGLTEVILATTGAVLAQGADGSQLWKSSTFGATRIVGAYDLDGDGALEVVAFGASPAGIYVLAGNSGQTAWFLPLEESQLDALVVPGKGVGSRLYIGRSFNETLAYDFAAGIVPSLAWKSADKGGWSTDFASGDVDGDAQLDVVQGRDRGFVVLDSATGAVKCDGSNVISTPFAGSYFPSFTVKDVDLDGAGEIVLYDYSYYYSEDVGVYVVKCTPSAGGLVANVAWQRVWLTDVDQVPGTNVNDKQIRWLADGAADLDGKPGLEVAFSLYDGQAPSWTTYVVDGATGIDKSKVAGVAIEAVGQFDQDAPLELALREATGIGADLPTPNFSALRVYDLDSGTAVEKGWAIDSARAATVPGRFALVATAGAGVVGARQNTTGKGFPAEDLYVLRHVAPGLKNDSRPDTLVTVRPGDGQTLGQYGFPAGTTGSVYALGASLSMSGSTSEALLMLSDGGLRTLSATLQEAGSIATGNFVLMPSVVTFGGGAGRILAVDSSGRLNAIDGTKLNAGTPVTLWQTHDVAQNEARGYEMAPALVLPDGKSSSRLLVRTHSKSDYSVQAVAALGSDGQPLWMADLGAGRSFFSTDGFEPCPDLDGDGLPDFFMTEVESTGGQSMVVRKGSDGSTIVGRATGALFPGTSGPAQGHALADVNGDSVPDVVLTVSDHWFAAFDVSKAATGDPSTGITSIFQTLTMSAYGQAIIGQLDSDPSLDLVRVNSQSAFGAYQRFDLSGAEKASYTPPNPGLLSSDANGAALVRRPGGATTFDLVWAGMAGAALGKVGRVDGETFTEVWSVYLAAGASLPGSSPPSNGAALYDPITADIDGDGEDDILVGSDDGYVYALRVADGSLEFALQVGAPVVHLIAADIDKDPELELLASIADGRIIAIDGPAKYTYDDVTPPDGGLDSDAGADAGAADAANDAESVVHDAPPQRASDISFTDCSCRSAPGAASCLAPRGIPPLFAAALATCALSLAQRRARRTASIRPARRFR